MGTFTSRQRTFSLDNAFNGHLHKSPTHLLPPRCRWPRLIGSRRSPQFPTSTITTGSTQIHQRSRQISSSWSTRARQSSPTRQAFASSHRRLSTCLARPTFAPRRTGVWEAYPETDNFDFACGEAPTSVQAALRGPRPRTVSSISIPPSAGSRSRSSAAATRRKETATTANTAGPSRGGAAPTSCRPRTPTYTTSSQPMAR